MSLNTEEEMISNKPTPVFVRASAIPDYQDCPVSYRRDGYPQPDGTYLDGDTFQPEDFFTNCGFLVVMLGNVERETSIEMSATAIHSSIQSLFSGCRVVPVDLERVRTFVELEKSIDTYRGKYSHVIIVGHSSKDGISFLDKDNPTTGEELVPIFECWDDCDPIQIISLCCHSGCESFAGDLSTAKSVSEVIASNSEFHIQWTVHFVIGYLLSFFLDGLSVDDAVRNAMTNPSKTPMCVWRNGTLSCPPKS